MNVEKMTAAVFKNPGRISFTMSRYDLLRLAYNAILAAIRGEIGIAVNSDDVEVLQDEIISNQQS